MADLLAWILQEQGVSFIIHYLDDFLTIGPPNSTICYHNLNAIIRLCKVLGVPLAVEKVSGPSTTIEFLGIILDTGKMEACLPAEKLARTKQMVTEWLGRKNAKKREILSLVGVLQHAAKVVPSGRTFVSRMYATASKVAELDFYTRLNKGFQSDLQWWHTFLQLWNGKSFLQMLAQPQPQVFIQTDASGSWGCGAFYNGKWLQWHWPEDWYQLDIMTKELAPIVLACAVWGKELSSKAVQFQCDNAAVVAALKKGSAKDEFIMHLLRSMWFFTAFYNNQGVAIAGPISCQEIICTCFFVQPSGQPVTLPIATVTPRNNGNNGPRLDTSNLHSAVSYYYSRGLANSTMRSYQAGQKRYLSPGGQQSLPQKKR